MEKTRISQDDLLDIVEMTNKIEMSINEIVHESELNIAISAIMNSYINIIILQSKTKEEAYFYRDVFYRSLNAFLNHIK